MFFMKEKKINVDLSLFGQKKILMHTSNYTMLKFQNFMKWGIVEMVACTVVSGFIWNQEKTVSNVFQKLIPYNTHT